MCKLCETPLRYGTLYDSAFISKNKNEWLRQFSYDMSKGCLAYQCRAAKYIDVAMNTQAIFSRVDVGIARRIQTKATRTLTVKQMRMRRLARRMLSHAYRPGGRMYHSTLQTLCRESSVQREDENNVAS